MNRSNYSSFNIHKTARLGIINLSIGIFNHYTIPIPPSNVDRIITHISASYYAFGTGYGAISQMQGGRVMIIPANPGDSTIIEPTTDTGELLRAMWENGCGAEGAPGVFSFSDSSFTIPAGQDAFALLTICYKLGDGAGTPTTHIGCLNITGNLRRESSQQVELELR